MKLTQSLLALTLVSASIAHADVIYQSGAYGSTSGLAEPSFCSNCAGGSGSDQYIGEKFSISSDSAITGFEFYASGWSIGSGDLTIAFFDAPDSLVHSQTFTLAEQIKTTLNDYTTNIAVNFTPFQLDAGGYAVFFLGTDLGINAFAGYGNSQLWISPSTGVPTSAPIETGYSSAIRLSGTAVSTVPEPETYVLLSLGLGLIGYTISKKSKKYA